MTENKDTIFALATASGQAGLAVIRVSGPQASVGFSAITKNKNITARQAVYTALTDPADMKLIDHGICLYFQAPQSFTGEDVVEYTVHGGRAVIAKLLDVLAGLDGHRMALPGEFTKRAFMNGKLDLTAAEAVADLIHAETEAQRLVALDQLGGRLESLYHDWAQRLAKLLAHQEAEIEFPDEDMPTGIDEGVRAKVTALIAEIDRHLNDNHKGERLREGMQIAIIGAPNAGKSSLLNWLARRDAAIVSDLAGTTRDIVDVSLNLGGYPVVISDTAGLRAEHQDKVEAEGIRRAIARAQQADLKIAVFDMSIAPDESTLAMIDDKTVIVCNKIDMKPVSAGGALSKGLNISLKTQSGLDALLEHITQQAKRFFSDIHDAPLLTRARHRDHLTQCRQALSHALDADLPELAAEDLRQAMLAIGRITGRVDVEDLLDIVFRDFCIGK